MARKSNKPKWSRGPWTQPEGFGTLYSRDGKVVCSMNITSLPTTEIRANIRLITAAEKLYLALKDAYDILELEGYRWTEIGHNAKAALEEANG